ncbi:hypothetical protein SMICM304S_12160 [Streptomyces microflavus]
MSALDGAGHKAGREAGTGPGQPGSGRRAALVPIVLVVGGGLSVQFGSAVAALLMPKAGALGVVTLRLAAAALILLVVCRPKLRGHSRADWGTVVAFGVAMGGMNTLFYQALDRIPLGIAVTLEVLGPLALSVFASRRLINVLWAGLALVGVVLLGGGGFDRLDPVGAAYALAAGGMWAAYIVFSARTGRRFPQADGLALAMVVAAVLSLPLGIWESGSKLTVPSTLALGAAVAVLSSVLPYTLELMALRRLPALHVRGHDEPGTGDRGHGGLPDPEPGPVHHGRPRHRAGHRGEHGRGTQPDGSAAEGLRASAVGAGHHVQGARRSVMESASSAGWAGHPVRCQCSIRQESRRGHSGVAGGSATGIQTGVPP